ncbi:MAG: hypothetical protein H0T95_11895 [Chthoniobacterales bacterium]|nr:hypothetical protein [Chthoniobacterales bacterium]
MNNRPSDLLTLISEARRLVPDDRHIWCSASETFESRIMQRRGVLLGGALSPHFLRDSTAMSWDIPWAVRLRHCRVVVCDKAAQEPLAAWLPLMESVAGAGEALLVVTETIGSELLSTFVVNAFKGTLPVCVVHPARDRSGSPAPGTQFATPPTGPDRLLRVDEVWIRRTATACFPDAGDPLSSAAALQNLAIIETGGENHEDQYARLRFLMRELQQTDGR